MFCNWINLLHTWQFWCDEVFEDGIGFLSAICAPRPCRDQDCMESKNAMLWPRKYYIYAEWKGNTAVMTKIHLKNPCMNWKTVPGTHAKSKEKEKATYRYSWNIEIFQVRTTANDCVQKFTWNIATVSYIQHFKIKIWAEDDNFNNLLCVSATPAAEV